jgi:hypothetical protein
MYTGSMFSEIWQSIAWQIDKYLFLRAPGNGAGFSGLVRLRMNLAVYALQAGGIVREYRPQRMEYA